MKVLLDTHAFIWWDSEISKLSATARSVCCDPNNSILLSVASVWEMQIKLQIGKLVLQRSLADILSAQQRSNGLTLLSIQLEHILALDQLPPVHKDPFDRLLAAQSLLEAVPLVSNDGVFANYPVSVLW